MRSDWTKEGLTGAKRCGMSARMAGEIEWRDGRARLEGRETESGVRVLPGPSTRVYRVATGPVPDFKRTARADGGEAVAMCVGIVPGKGLSVEWK